MMKYLEGANPYTIMIPDSVESLYKLYTVEKSTAKVLKGLFNGAVQKAWSGVQMQTNPVKQDGNLNRIGADFLINEQGTIVAAHYGRYIGDHLPIAVIEDLLDR